MKKLSILINSLDGGGAERVVSLLINSLQNKYEIVLVLMNDSILYEIPEGVKIFYIDNGADKKGNLIKLLKLPILGYRYSKLCKDLLIDFSTSFTYRPNFINVIAKLFRSKSKCIVSERSMPSLTYEGLNISSILGRYLVSYLYSRADLILPNSKAASTDLIKNFKINPKKIKVIQNPNDINKVISMGKRNVESFFFNSKFTFISVSRLEENKNHEITIRAFAQLYDDNAQLLIIGKGPLKKSLNSLIKCLGMENKIHIMGFTKNPFKYMAKSDCFILSSKREGFPNVLLEALACGLFLVSSNCKGGSNEIINDKKLGLLYETGNIGSLVDIMKFCIRNRDTLKNPKKKLEKIKQFNIVKISNKFCNVIENLK